MSDTIHSETAIVTQTLQSSNRVAADTERQIVKVFDKLNARSSDLATLQDSQLETSRSFTSELKASLRGIQEGDLNSLIQALSHLGIQLESSGQLVDSLHQRQYHVDARMEALQESFAGLESRAAAFGATQILQAETQSDLHHQMETAVQVASQLRNVMMETSSKIESVTALAHTFGAVFDWAMIAFLGFLGLLTVTLLAAIWRLSRTGSVCVLATMASFAALNVLGYPTINVGGWF